MISISCWLTKGRSLRMKRSGTLTRESVGTRGHRFTQQLQRHRIVQTAEYTCGLVAVQSVQSFFSHGRRVQPVKSLVEKLRELGFPKSCTGTSSLHIAWL